MGTAVQRDISFCCMLMVIYWGKT